MSLFIDRKMSVYFDSFGIEDVPQKVLNKIKDKSITHKIFRIPYDYSVMFGFYCIPLIEYLIVRKTWLDYTNLFLPNDYQKNDNI